VTRQEKAAMAARLQVSGMTARDIGSEMGLAVQTIRDLLWDPDGSKVRARKDSYRGSCAECGAPTDGSNGSAKAPKLCIHHAPRVHLGIWTREACIDAIRDFHDEHGRIPTAGEMGVGPMKHQRVDWLPWPTTLRSVFGTSAAAMRAAGFEPNPTGYYARPSKVIARER
jgi:hypothetical protein